MLIAWVILQMQNLLNRGDQFVHISPQAIGAGHVLEMTPEALDRVQLGTVSGQPNDLQTMLKQAQRGQRHSLLLPNLHPAGSQHRIQLQGRFVHQVGIDKVLAEVLPQAKAEEANNLQAKGKKVAMVGDGVNDAPALAQADVGMAIGSGTDVAKETGDLILIKDDIRDVIVALETARATMRKVKQNLFWAFFYNTMAIPIGAGLLYPFIKAVISPELAGALMALSSITVTLNTMLLKRFRPSLRQYEKLLDQSVDRAMETLPTGAD